jgi:hypothetical protein
MGKTGFRIKDTLRSSAGFSLEVISENQTAAVAVKNINIVVQAPVGV